MSGEVWRRAAKPRPFTVWEGDEWSAAGRDYRTRLGAIVAAWFASLYARKDVWIEHNPPTLTPEVGS